jgi:hypothetical protein
VGTNKASVLRTVELEGNLEQWGPAQAEDGRVRLHVPLFYLPKESLKQPALIVVFNSDSVYVSLSRGGRDAWFR